MIENELATNQFMVDYLLLLVPDIDDPELDHQPNEAFNPPRWTLGHLAVYTDYALRLTGSRFACPKTWHRAFARGSKANSTPSELPSKSELVEAIVSGFTAVRERCGQLTADELGKLHTVPFLRDTALTTVGHVLSHLMTTHFAAHLGQLSAWRRIKGRANVEPAAPLK